ncbi:MAG: hypothetical protein GFH27_549347n52 [Chloroflexi bacterium AL-W]|nr:hypothetical protein [Chloroflexi bacterium AL-N1]NOK70834.1 hypothetical protein [Chloroflexi bacterium AL-N10]NOK78394.1 hypothetical protein [Chloroflexi bacterium AL-N5]NOK85375.1 hypothetical protein [Chloroflexi bacterium AL-W]NOK92651.1 hypothetical protein [Chloroflexi bacterium AL-N15]
MSIVRSDEYQRYFCGCGRRTGPKTALYERFGILPYHDLNYQIL